MNIPRNHENYHLSLISPIKLNCIIKKLYIPNSETELKDLLFFLKKNKINFLVIGKMSNTIIKPDQFNCINKAIILTSKLNKIIIDVKKNEVVAQAGVLLSRLGREMSERSCIGFSGLLGFPASIGGGIYMNAGSYGNEVSDYLVNVKCITPDGKELLIKKKELNFSWRFSEFQKKFNNLIIIEARFHMIKGNKNDIDKHITVAKHNRIKYQERPGNNLGSTFATKWIYSDIVSKNISFNFVRIIFNTFFKILLFFRLYFIIPFVTKIFIRYCKKKFKINDQNQFLISDKTLNCITIDDKNVTPLEYIEYIYELKKKLNLKSAVEIQIKDGS
jgi:UDP-N-acetylmuramate dehydrogenase